MKFIQKSGLFLLLIISLSSFTLHKYYISLTDIKYNEKNKSFEIISNAFIDDLELTLENLHQKDLELDTPKEAPDAKELMKNYVEKHLEIWINKKKQKFKYIGKEYDTDIVLFYLEIPFQEEIKSFEIKNTAIMETYPEQRNIIKLEINGKYKTFHLTKRENKGLLIF
ncbi:DUF6702 family protein [Aureivirga marina]|uniref:DUF6702 family protein n=1 Tax=Aureivirga marina TaxID=1182451 RepID=UPI0018C94B83|nr:DUF6702 family protein [Aureivirga marina]